jgi:hypothetical protein
MNSAVNINKFNVNGLLKTSTIEELITLFQNINSKVDQALEILCAGFSNLHSVMHKTYDNFNLISRLLSKLPDAEESQNKIYSININKSITRLNNYLSAFEKNIDFNKQAIEQLDSKFEKISNQAVQLSANVMEIKNKYEHDVSLFNKKTITDNTIVEIIKEIIVISAHLFENLKKTQRYIRNSIIAIGSFKKNYFENTYKIIENFNRTVTLINYRHAQFLPLKQSLLHIQDTIKESSSAVIVNLQFQDIIKQKMQHIKTNHTDLIHQLSCLSGKSDEPAVKLAKAKLFLKIGEIANLQTAQIIYTKTEYKNARRNIIMELNKIIEQFFEAYLQVKNSVIYSEHSDNIDCEQNIRRQAQLINEIDIMHSMYQLQTESIIQYVTNFSDIFLKDSNKILSLLKALNENQTIYKELCEINRLEPLINKLTEIITQSQKYLNDITIIIKSLQNSYLSNYIKPGKEHQHKNEVRELSRFFRELIFSNNKIINFNISEAEISNLVLDANVLNLSEHADITFDKEISSIIKYLSEIRNKMNIAGKSLNSVKLKNETAEHIKKRYTTKSERMVHEYYLKNNLDENNDNFFYEKINSFKNDDQDLTELF